MEKHSRKERVCVAGLGGGEENNLARREGLKETGVSISVQNSQGCHSERLLTNSPALTKLALQIVAGMDAISSQGAFNGDALLTLYSTRLRARDSKHTVNDPPGEGFGTAGTVPVLSPQHHHKKSHQVVSCYASGD